ncbi:MAG: TVP38/TMEM64 family protein [Alkalispirochaetaceae bacterium]
MAEGATKSNVGRLLAVVAIIVVGVVVAWQLGAFEYISMDNIQTMRSWINGLGWIGPVIYVGLYMASALFFIPGSPLALLAGFVFGPIWGALLAVTGATLGAAAAFLAARYAAREMVAGWMKSNPQLKKIDDGVNEQGWRMLMITRLVPVFPYNVQNFVYGLTKINLLQFVLVSWICMLPGAVAFAFMAGSIAAGEGMGNTLIYLGVGAVFFVILSLIPGWIKKRNAGKVAAVVEEAADPEASE